MEVVTGRATYDFGVVGVKITTKLYVAHPAGDPQAGDEHLPHRHAKRAFGELYVGDRKPQDWKQVFASVQSLATLGLDKIASDDFDVVVIDEFHHAQAPTYCKIIDHLHHQELLGSDRHP